MNAFFDTKSVSAIKSFDNDEVVIELGFYAHAISLRVIRGEENWSKVISTELP